VRADGRLWRLVLLNVAHALSLLANPEYALYPYNNMARFGLGKSGGSSMEFDLNLASQVLARTPPTVRQLLQGLSDGWVFGDEGPDTWSPFDILGHLIHGERTDWIPRAQIILKSGTSQPFEPFDRFAQFQVSQGKSLDELLDTFAALRQANLQTLEAMHLLPSDLEQEGIHPELGAVTLRQLLATWMVHDLSHISQIAEVMARQYRQAVGPWKAYLPVLQVES
jgi:hypothetical protein